MSCFTNNLAHIRMAALVLSSSITVVSPQKEGKKKKWWEAKTIRQKRMSFVVLLLKPSGNLDGFIPFELKQKLLGYDECECVVGGWQLMPLCNNVWCCGHVVRFLKSPLSPTVRFRHLSTCICVANNLNKALNGNLFTQFLSVTHIRPIPASSRIIIIHHSV